MKGKVLNKALILDDATVDLIGLGRGVSFVDEAFLVQVTTKLTVSFHLLQDLPY